MNLIKDNTAKLQQEIAQLTAQVRKDRCHHRIHVTLAHLWQRPMSAAHLLHRPARFLRPILALLPQVTEAKRKLLAASTWGTPQLLEKFAQTTLQPANPPSGG